MSEFSKPKPTFKAWLETDEGYVFGPGVYRLLKRVRETGTLKEAAESLDMSYRFAWGLVKKAEEKIGQPLLHAHKGGRAGGGGAELTALGLQFLEDFSKVESMINELSTDSGLLDGFRSKNLVEATVTEMNVVGDKIDFTIRTKEPASLRLSVSRKSFESIGISIGDNLKLETTTTVGTIRKGKH